MPWHITLIRHEVIALLGVFKDHDADSEMGYLTSQNV